MEALGKRPHPDTRKQGGGWRILGLVSSARLGYSILVGFGIEPLAIQGGCLWRSAVAPAKACLLFFLFASAAARDGVDLNLDWDLDSVGVQVCVCAGLAKLLFAVCLTSALATHRIQFILAETILALKTTIYCRSTRPARVSASDARANWRLSHPIQLQPGLLRHVSNIGSGRRTVDPVRI